MVFREGWWLNETKIFVTPQKWINTSSRDFGPAFGFHLVISLQGNINEKLRPMA